MELGSVFKRPSGPRRRGWGGVWSVLLMATALPGCEDPDNGVAVGRWTGEIRNGTLEPQVIPLSQGHQLAIGFVASVRVATT